MNKNKFEIISLYDNDIHAYWKKKTYLERLNALEQLRRTTFNYDPSTKRLQRILTITKLKKD